jgi:hypothetical protein
MVGSVCSRAVIRKGGVHHLKPDSPALDVCNREREKLREREREMGERIERRRKKEIESTVKIVEICITSCMNTGGFVRSN